MPPPIIWFNKHLSNTWEVIALLQDARAAGEFRVVCSHPRADYAQRVACDHFEQEPGGLDNDAYLEFCLDFAERHAIDYFFPGRKLLAITRAADRFAALGVRVASSSAADSLTLLQSKASVYRAIAGLGIVIPDFEVVNDLAGFDAAYARLRQRHHVVCFKPDIGVYGIGFYVVAEAGSNQINHESTCVLTLEDARRRLGAEPRFRDLLVMQYLPGPERSVDCLARAGTLLRCVVRHKLPGGQRLEDNPALESAARTLVERFGLSHLFNVQFRDSAGVPYLLEINPRMSGGLPFSCQSGLPFLLWSIRLALGSVRDEEIPWPRAGVWVPQPVIESPP